MSSAMWFAVCVPKKEYETKKWKKAKEASDTASGGSSEKSDDVGYPKGQQAPIPEAPPSIQGEDEKRESAGRNDVSNGSTQQAGMMPPTPGSEYGDLVYFVEKRGTMEERLQDALEFLGVKDAVWCDQRNANFHQVFFPCESVNKCDHTLRVLLARGIGLARESTVGVLPCMVFYQEEEEEEESKDDLKGEAAESDAEESATGKGEKKSKFKSMQQKFLKSVTARLTVAQVVDSVRAGTQLTFDYVMFVVLASMIAALGLMENSSVVIVASMLISPLMGPILAGTFGWVIRDRPLLILGIKAEIVGLMACISIGFFMGLICGNFANDWGPLEFPTNEMASRGQDRSLWVGVLIALPSGAGVALSVLGGNAGSLVGVAISASLLPPAVNAGLLWGLAVIKKIHSLSSPMIFLPDSDDVMNEALIPPKGYEVAYRKSMDQECAILGVISLLLTIVNIICIVISAMLVLKIKEVAPRTSIPNMAKFWNQDIKIARDYNKTVTDQEGGQLGKNFLREWANLNNLDTQELLSNSEKARFTQYQTLQDILQDVEDDNVYQTVMRYVPGTHAQNLTKRFTIAADVQKPYEYQRLPRPSLGGDLEAGGHMSLSPTKRNIQKRKRDQAYSPYDTHPQAAEPYHDDLTGVQLRHDLSPGSPSGNRGTNSLLRLSWQQGASPYSLWPTQNARRRMSRFIVTPVDDPLPPLPPRYARSMLYGQVESNI